MSPLERGLSLAAGAIMASRALRRRSPGALLLGAAGAYLAFRGVTGRCPLYRALGITGSEVGTTVTACSQITVQLPVDTVYRFWRDPANLPRFSSLLERVEPVGGGVWRFRQRGRQARGLEWDARATVDDANERLAWCAVEGAELPSALQVRFTERGEGTEVFVDAWLVPPAGPLVSAALRRADRTTMLRRAGFSPSEILEQELRRMRQVLEAGETATIRGQSSGRELSNRRGHEAVRREEEEGSTAVSMSEGATAEGGRAAVFDYGDRRGDR